MLDYLWQSLWRKAKGASKLLSELGRLAKACESCVNENAVFAIGPGLLNVFETMVKCSKSDVGGVPYSALAP